MRERIATSAWIVSCLTVIFVVVFTYSLWAFSICYIYSRFVETLSLQEIRQGSISDVYNSAPYKILSHTFKPQVMDIDLLYSNIQSRNFQSLSELIKGRVRIDPDFASNFSELIAKASNLQIQLLLLNGQLNNIKNSEESFASRYQSYLVDLSIILAQEVLDTDNLKKVPLSFYQSSLLSGLPVIPALENGISNEEELINLLTIGKEQALRQNPEKENFDPIKQIDILRRLSMDLEEEMTKADSRKEALAEEIAKNNNQLESITVELKTLTFKMLKARFRPQIPEVYIIVFDKIMNQAI